MGSPGRRGTIALHFACRPRGCQWQNAVPMKRKTPPGRTPRVRSLGHGRKLRRALARGGTGPARALNTTLGGWDGVRITPMFGRWGYFVGERLFACFPLRDKERDLWIRLGADDQARARARSGRNFASKTRGRPVRRVACTYAKREPRP